MDKLTDKDLITKYLKGEEKALEALIGRYLRLVYSFVYRRTGQEAEVAEDITQEVFVKMWKNLKRFDRKKIFRAWIFCLAKNTCIDFLRKKKTVPFSRFEDGKGDNSFIDNIADGGLSPLEILSRKNLVEIFYLALQNLSPKYREVFSLRHNKQFTFQEIAEYLGKPLDTVKSIYRRGVIELRKVLLQP